MKIKEISLCLSAMALISNVSNTLTMGKDFEFEKPESEFHLIRENNLPAIYSGYPDIMEEHGSLEFQVYLADFRHYNYMLTYAFIVCSNRDAAVVLAEKFKPKLNQSVAPEFKDNGGFNLFVSKEPLEPASIVEKANVAQTVFTIMSVSA